MKRPSKPLCAALLLCLASLAVACDEASEASLAEDLDPQVPSYAGPEPTPVSAGDCCETDSSPGCSDTGVEACVCAVDSYCCTTAWDGLCVSEVESLGCGSCATGWGRGIGGSGSEAVEPSGAVATDAAGNIYVIGTFYSATIDLGGGPLTRQGYSDVFLVSYAPDGSYRWSRRIGGNSWEYGR
ncbi:MAG TPA: hypothetical protein VM869_32165, partial [Enhygromyxa sp.]|nr:hypothetical protein [Enhygromyxa sp.]